MQSLGIEDRPSAVNHPWDGLIVGAKRRDRLTPGASLAEVFRESQRALLILGDAGSGKTTTLLELCRELLDQSERDPSQPVPVVLNLSTWSDKRESFLRWLCEELRKRYRLSEQIAFDWIRQTRLLLLLDGLNELAESRRAGCVRAINRFLPEAGGTSGIVVCCRLEDYLALPRQLDFGGAICLQPLTKIQVDSYIEKAGPQLSGLSDALKNDAALRELAQSPLMLSVMALTYEANPATPPSVDHHPSSIEESRRRLFLRYISHMFVRRSTSSRSAGKKWADEIGSAHFLSRLAQKMKGLGQTIFAIEDLEPSWLRTKWQLAVYLTCSRVIAAWVLLLAFLTAAIVGMSVIEWQVAPPQPATPASLGDQFPAPMPPGPDLVEHSLEPPERQVPSEPPSPPPPPDSIFTGAAADVKSALEEPAAGPWQPSSPNFGGKDSAWLLIWVAAVPLCFGFIAALQDYLRFRWADQRPDRSYEYPGLALLMTHECLCCQFFRRWQTFIWLLPYLITGFALISVSDSFAPRPVRTAPPEVIEQPVVASPAQESVLAFLAEEVLLFLAMSCYALYWGLFFTLHGTDRSTRTDITPTEWLGWSGDGAKRGIQIGVICGACWGAVIGFIFGCVTYLIASIIAVFSQVVPILFKVLLSDPEIPDSSTRTIGFSVAFLIAAIGMVVGAFGGAVFGAACGGIASKLNRTKSRPNEGIWLALRNSVMAGGISAIAGAIFTAAFGGTLFFEMLRHLGEREWVAAFAGVSWWYLTLASAIIGGGTTSAMGWLCYGGFDVIKHFSLRLALTLGSELPLRIAPTCEFAADRVLLRRTGGAYIFLHPMLMQCFAELNEEDLRVIREGN